MDINIETLSRCMVSIGVQFAALLFAFPTICAAPPLIAFVSIKQSRYARSRVQRKPRIIMYRHLGCALLAVMAVHSMCAGNI